MTDFMRDPFSDIDTTCVQTAPPINFFVPADWVITTANYQLYTTLTASTTLALVFVIALGLFLVELLMLAAADAHGGPGIFQRPKEFPRGLAVDFPLSPEAERYYK
jgi:hypothetical protein